MIREEMMAFRPDPKPTRRARKQIRHVDRKATTLAVLAQPWCSICLGSAATGHHVLAKGAPHFGDDVPANIVALCGSGTTGCHGRIEDARKEARAALGAYLLEKRPDTLEYLRSKLGPSAASEWLLRHLHVRVPA